MTKYAYYNSNILPNDQVIGWIDSESETNMPPTSDLLEITGAQWEARTSDVFYIVDGVLTGSQKILTAVQAQKIMALSLACQKQIIAGFTSSALGAAHTYASDAVSQRNILLAAQSINGGLLSCADSTGAWSRQPHTQTQVQQVAADFVSASDAARAKLSGLEVQVGTASTVDAVKAIVWESGK